MVQLTVEARDAKPGYVLAVGVGGQQRCVQLGRRSVFDFDVSGEASAKVDLYQRVSSCTVSFDAGASSCQSLQLPLNMSLQVGASQGLSWNSMFGWCNSQTENSEFTTSVSAVPVHDPVMLEDRPRMLVLTDVGEEIDDEASLWLLHQHLKASPRLQADIVFVTGSPLERATRWATWQSDTATPMIGQHPFGRWLELCFETVNSGQDKAQAQVLNSLPENHKLPDSIQYFVGPTTGRHMRYRMMADAQELRRAGLAGLIDQPWQGGKYDVVLQISPISGFSADFANPPPPPAGALALVEPRPGAQGLLYLVVGGEGATNFPRDELHVGFKELMVKKGFRAVHVEKANYLNWEKAMFETFPPKLTELVLDDEWNKAVGRIPPMVANLFVRFRVNTLVNYEVVDRAFAAFEEDLRGTPDFVKATQWWVKVEKKVLQDIKTGYIKKSRDADNKSKDCMGNEPVSSKVKGMKMSWESIMSRICVRDILASTDITETTFSKNTVDDIMGYAVTMMTSKLLRIYAYNRYVSGRDPDVAQLEPYLLGNKERSSP
ncbi:unnamed protein product [Effrenium voratum]|uniref:Uncharacterized protein n=1 Tax=Effrenium voratum TaxID=2562239 RepID=A0AA36NIP7_9DINO|nr:unnamed protein product [Effrenium voratum]